MKDLPIPRRACWDLEAALYVLQTEALTNTGAAFLATHTPVEGFTVEGNMSASVLEHNEKGLLDALSDQKVRHAFAVVQGEPGSGKSHLIRWMAESWPRGRDIPVLLRRAEASLEGSLRGLREAIPLQYKEIVGTIELKQVKALKGRIADFTSNLSNSLDAGYYEKAPPDKQFCDEHHPGEILRNEDVRLHWKAPARIVNLLSGNGSNGSPSDRNSESASFNILEIANLATFAKRVEKTSLRSGRLLSHIAREASVIEEAVRDGVSADFFLTTHRSKAPFAAQMTEALNSRRNAAIQSSLGISSAKLKEIFQDLRRALKTDEKRLVILLEDITAWEGIDDGLIDILIDDARYSGDTLCDQIAVVGVTPYYFKSLKGNYQQRVTHNISLGHGVDQLQDTANLREPWMRSRFVATYLKAIRAGGDEIQSWRDRKRDDTSKKLLNRCDVCPMNARAECHKAFGEFEGIGLYPFNDRAIESFYAALSRQVSMTWRTPRGVIQGILVPTMTRPRSLDEGVYPVREVEAHEGVDQDASSLFGATKARLDASVPDAADRERARRLIAFWGTRGDNETRQSKDGVLTYATVPKIVFDSFGLPWIGDSITSKDHRPDDGLTHTDVSKVTIEVVTEFDESPIEDEEPDATDRSTIQSPTAKERVARTKQSNVTKSIAPIALKPLPQREVVAFQQEIQAFIKDNNFRNPSTWNAFAKEMLFRLDARRLGIDEAQFKILFKEDLIKVKGTVKVLRKDYFEIPVDAWFIDGLDAYTQLRNNDHFRGLPARDQDLVRRQVARCLRRLESLARRHVNRWNVTLVDGSPWSLKKTATEVLLVRAWLRGDVAPTADTIDQWKAVVKGDGPISTDPRSRVDSWDAILRRTNESHSAMRGHLLEAVRLAQGKSDSHGLSDAAEPIAAIEKLKAEFRLSERPKTQSDILPDSIQMKIWDAGEVTAEKLTRLPNDEYDRIIRRLADIDRILRGNGIADHVRRVEAVVRSADDRLPPASKQTSVTAWLRLKDTMVKRDNAHERLTKIEDAILALLGESKPDRRLLTLALVVEQHVSSIEEASNVLDAAERMIGLVKTAVADYVGTIHPGAMTIGNIQNSGGHIAAQVGEALEAWPVNA